MRPILLRIGPVEISSFFFFSIVALGVAVGLAVPRARRIGFSLGQIFCLVLGATTGFLAGSRLGYLLWHWEYYRLRPDIGWGLRSGGWSLFPGLFAALAVTALLLKRWKRPVAEMVHRMMPSVVLAQAIVRIGCLLQGCCYGRLTTMPWGVVYPLEVSRRHPSQLYEAFFLAALLGVLLWAERRWKGTLPLFYLYGVSYGTFRFFADFLRADDSPVLGGLTSSQIVGMGLALVCGILWWRLRRCTRSC